MAFDPQASQRPPRRRQRGSRFRLLLILAVLLLAGGIVFERWLFDWRFGGSPAPPPEIRQTRAVAPDFQLPPPEPALEPAALPVAPRIEPPTRVAPVQGSTRAAELPTRIAFEVDVEPPEMGWFEDGRRPKLAVGCALRPGATVIHAALETTIQSEIGGQAIAQVSEDVYDVDHVGRLLIPAGTKAVGVYKKSGQLDFQRRRLDFVWTEMTLPDGTQIALGGADGMDVAGAMGVGGEVRTRWGELVATAALLTVFDGIQRGTVADDRSLAASLQQSASRTTGGLGEEVTRKVLDWEPEIMIPGGTPIVIAPRKTIQVC